MSGSVVYWTSSKRERAIGEQCDDWALIDVSDGHARPYPTGAVLARTLSDERRLNGAQADNDGPRLSDGATILHVVLHDA
jgi:hypothetical protein